MPAAGTFTVVMDPEEVIGGEGESGRLTVRFQGGSDYALFGGDELRVIDKFGRTGNQATAVQSGYELVLPTDVPSDGLAADSTVGYDLVWFTKDARVPALFTAQPAGTTVLLSALVNQEPGIPLEVSAGYAQEAQMWAAQTEELQDAAVTTLLSTATSAQAAADARADARIKVGQTLNDNARFIFTANTTSGITRLVTFKSATATARPWISWIDEADRHRVAMGYHSQDPTSGDWHNAFEIKISTSPGAVNPGDMKTRFSLSTDVEVGTASFSSTEELTINRGVFAASTPIGLLIRSPDSGATSRQLAQFKAQFDASENTILAIDALTKDTTKSATINIFRSTNAVGATAALLAIKKGTNTNTNAFLFNASRSWLQIYDTNIVPSSSAAGSGHLYVESGALKWRGSSGTVTTIANA